jgi:hypothetical protein
MGQAGRRRDEDERALLGLLPADGDPVSSEKIRRQLGWDVQRYAGACMRLEDERYLLRGQGRGETICRDLAAVPQEFRPACGHPARMSRCARCPSR